MEQVTEELVHSLEELANGVAAHAERRIQLVGVRDNDLLVAAADALAFGVDAGSMLLHNFAAVFADDLMSAIAIIDILPVVFHVVASGLLSAALDALAINVGAGNILAHNCLAVIAQNIVGTIVVGNKREVLTHVVASRLLSAALGALAINVGAGNILAHNCIAVSAQNIVGAIVVGNKLEVLLHVVASRLKSAAGALAIGVDTRNSRRNGLVAVSADDVVGAIVQILVHPVVFRVVALLMTAANADGLTVTVLVDVRQGINDFTIFSADVRAGTIAVVDTDLIDMVTLRSSGSKCSGDHGHCHHSGQNDRCNPRNSLLSQFHKTTSKIFCVSKKEESLSEVNPKS